MKFRIMRSHLGGYVDVPHPMMPGTTGLYLHGTREQVMRNLRAIGVGLVGIKLVAVDECDRPIKEAA